jgi:hypothetical protein
MIQPTPDTGWGRIKWINDLKTNEDCGDSIDDNFNSTSTCTVAQNLITYT